MRLEHAPAATRGPTPTPERAPATATLLVLTCVALCASVAASACADLPPIASDVCGNGVRDLDEDCDSFADPDLGPGTVCASSSDSTRACRYVCSQTQPCPIGWGCGPDGICRYSSGSYDEGPDSPLRVSADRLEVADFDGDERPDVLAISGANLELRFGGADGRFATQFQGSTDFPSGPLALGDLDQDGQADVVVPTAAGLFVMRGADQRTLDPIAYSPFAIPVMTGGVQALPIATEDLSPFDTIMLLIASCMIFDIDSGGLGCLPPRTSLPPGKFVGQLAGRVPRGDLQGGPAEEFALAFQDQREVFFYRIKDAIPGGDFTPQAELFTTVDVDEDILFGARFADLDGDGDLDLMVSTGTLVDDHVAVAFNDGTGKFSDALGGSGHAAADSFFECLAEPCVCNGETCPIVSVHGLRWPRAVGPLNDVDAVADFVSQDGVFLRAGPNFLFQTSVRTNPQPWTEAEIADFNRDGVNDIAAVVDGQDGVDFLTGVGNGLFNPSRIDTIDPPFALRVGDFDGDLVNDLAVGEHGILSGRGDDSLSVLFGRLQGPPEAPVSMGRLRYIEFMEPMRIITGLENIDMISDLVVQSFASFTEEGRDDRSLAFLMGSAQRRLLSPFVLSQPGGATDSPTGVLVGRFDGADEIPDMVALAPPRVWMVRGAGEAQFNAEDASAIDLSDVFGGLAAAQFDPNPFCSIFTAGDVTGDGLDDILGVDNNARCHGQGASPASRLFIGSLDGAQFTSMVVELGGGRTAPIEVKLADLDRDAHLDLVVVFAGDVSFDDPAGGPGVANDGVVVYWGTGSAGGFDFGAPSVVPAFEGAGRRRSAAAINADSDQQLELAVLTDGGIYVTNFSDARAFDAPLVPVVGIPGRTITAADVNADGLDDLLWVDENGTQVYVFTARPNLVANQDGRGASGTVSP